MKKDKKIPMMRSPTHSKYYVTNVRGGLTNQDVRFELMNEKLFNDNEEPCFVSDALLILSYKGAKRLQKILNESVKEYESKNDEIKLDEEDKKV